MPTAVEEARIQTIHPTGLKTTLNRADDTARQNAITDDARDGPTSLPASLCKCSLSRVRVQPVTASHLRSGLEFFGTQQSGRAVYEVKVSFKYVDIVDSFLCGFLKISGLSEDHLTLTTYFEGEIIGSKYSFITKNPQWNSSEKIDLEHWARFAAFKPIAHNVRNPRQQKVGAFESGLAGQDHVFMRWKELHILPNEVFPSEHDNAAATPATGANATQPYRDRRTRNLEGVSYAGFYYICLDQRNGSINGMYYHQNR